MTLVAEPHTPTDHCDPPTLNGAGRTTDTFGASVEHAFGADVLVDNRVNPHLRLVSGHERVLHPKPSGKPDPTAHLTAEQVETLGRELDALRQQVIDSRGASDAAYIRRVIAFNRYLELGSRAVLLFSLFPPAWIVGTVGLSAAKIIDNMEIGHNVLHGQWDWMRDPKIHSTTWEWDHVSPAKQWKESHNETHHTFTNVLGRDNDLGYGIIRVDTDQPWRLFFLGQPIYSFINALFFEWGIASYDVRLHDVLTGKIPKEEGRERMRLLLTKMRRQVLKDYVVHPLLSGPSFLPTMGANFVATIVRNLWSNGVILCGHFPFGVDTFAYDSIEDETRGEWYVRQMLGSANISGSWLLHFMSGNLSHQIEHHLFPDLPSNHYAKIAPQVREICARYGLHYVTGSYPRQLASSWAKVFYFALPDKEPGRSRARIIADAAKDAVVAGRAKARARVAARQR
ncbi:MAG: acyl-CoA desaturase [Actinomycetales bacterium]|nr:acyl-CoA desaturase [Actinomycetales bacterium]